MKTLYFDCFSGISGDMVIGALLDAGADPQILVQELKKLQFEDEYELEWKKVVKNGITSTKFDVILKNDDSNHTHGHQHDHEHTYDHHHEHDHNHHSHEHHHEHDHNHSHNHDHHHEHEHNHDHHHEHDHHHHSHDHHHEHGHSHDHHHHSHRSYKDIVKMIEQSELAPEVKETSLKVFRKIGEAEGLIHGLPLDKVHFHEVGAVDSIIDIVGAAILLHQLEVSTIKSSSVPVGTGKINIDHGIYPVPAPATLEILKGVPIEQSDIRFELTTPTGAGIVSVLTDEFCSFPSMKVTTIGYGAGTKTFKDRPNVLRVIIGE
ncbi:LarC family nickel insertion protein [Fredinandcohnia sp. FSL W7-1320]|uniref:LarC family nickel insertion protein n=1 Tax=Fredinandcohnia sp. FSL W7-1320 TaxID=2954540 RepID=UPI0030FD5129